MKFPAATAVLLCAFPFAAAWGAPEVCVYGNFQVTFYGNGDAYVDPDSEWAQNPKYGAKDWSPEMKSAVEDACNYWNGLIATKPTVPVKLHCIFDASTPSGFLARASSSRRYDAKSGAMLSNIEAFWREGMRDDGRKKDALMSFSPSANFYYGAEARLPGSGYADFRTVFTHELAHAMGFDTRCVNASRGWQDSVQVAGTKVLEFSTLDSLLFFEKEDGTRSRAIVKDGDAGPGGAGKFSDASSFAPGKNYFVALDAAGTQFSPLAIYNPLGFENGTSMAHLVDASGTTTPLLSPSLPAVQRALTDAELEIFKAMGWQVVVNIPEPSGIGMLIGIAALLLVSLRRKIFKKKTKLPFPHRSCGEADTP